MPDATFVAFVPQEKSAKLRGLLKSEDIGELRWSEKRFRRGSEFYFSGPPALARKTHSYVQHWVCFGETRPKG